MRKVQVKLRLEYPEQGEASALILAIENALSVKSNGPASERSSGEPGNELIISERPITVVTADDEEIEGKLYVRKRYRNGRLAHFHYELEAGEL